MKTFISFLLFTVFFQTLITAQQTDENTLVINNYFKVIDEEPVINNAIKDITNSYVDINQIGDENTTYIKSLQSGDNQIVVQKGNKNSYEFFNYYSRENSNLIINQEGNSNTLQIFGENSLMKNAIINQKSSFKTLVIKNYTN